MKKKIKELDVQGKTVLVRLDLNVPLEGHSVADDTRIDASLATLRYLVEKEAKVVVFSHLGRVKEEKDLKDLTLAPVAEKLGQKLPGVPVRFVAETRGPLLEGAVSKLMPGEILLVENTRFEDWPNRLESGNDPDLARYWAGLGDVFINDAFGTAHRSHASNVGLASYSQESAMGFLVEEEIRQMNQLKDNPESPFVVLLGGKKVGDKLPLVRYFAQKADAVLIGGAMAYTFLLAKGVDPGSSIVDVASLEEAKALLESYPDTIHLPLDNMAWKAETGEIEVISGDIPEDYEGMDIGPQTIELYEKMIGEAKSLFWNGPVGVFAKEEFSKGTQAMVQAISQRGPDLLSVVGGGDSAQAINMFGDPDDFTHVSTGGGASLAFFADELPAIEVLDASLD